MIFIALVDENIAKWRYSLSCETLCELRLFGRQLKCAFVFEHSLVWLTLCRIGVTLMESTLSTSSSTQHHLKSERGEITLSELKSTQICLLFWPIIFCHLINRLIISVAQIRGAQVTQTWLKVSNFQSNFYVQNEEVQNGCRSWSRKVQGRVPEQTDGLEGRTGRRKQWI